MSDESNKPDMTPGIVSWNELNTPNKAASVAFYTKLFGWSTAEMELPDGNRYSMFNSGEKPIAGCMVPPGNTGAPPMWLTYITVEDVDVAMAKAKALGGTLKTGRVDLPMGSFAVVTDPQGATFAFWKFAAESCD